MVFQQFSTGAMYVNGREYSTWAPSLTKQVNPHSERYCIRLSSTNTDLHPKTYTRQNLLKVLKPVFAIHSI